MGSPYVSFLLRIWQVSDASEDTWRASLEDPHTHQLIVFRSLDMLVHYLEEQTTKSVRANGAGRASDTGH